MNRSFQCSSLVSDHFYKCFCVYQCVVNVISELQAQMRKFQQEITTRIQKQRALEGQPESFAHNGSVATDHDLDSDMWSSNGEDCPGGPGGHNVGRPSFCREALLHMLPFLHHHHSPTTPGPKTNINRFSSQGFLPRRATVCPHHVFI